MIKWWEDGEVLHQRSLKRPFGTTLKVCCCIKMPGLKKGKEQQGGFILQYLCDLFSKPVNTYSHVDFALVKGLYEGPSMVRKARLDKQGAHSRATLPSSAAFNQAALVMLSKKWKAELSFHLCRPQAAAVF